MGSPKKFRWLADVDVTSHQKATEIRYEIPRRLAPCASASLFAQQKFDFAQDDIQWYYFSIVFRSVQRKHIKTPRARRGISVISILQGILFSLARGVLFLLCQNGLLEHPCF